MTTAKKQSGKLEWRKIQESYRVDVTIPVEIQTQIDQIKSSALPKATKELAIKALTASASGKPFGLQVIKGYDATGAEAGRPIVEVSGNNKPSSFSPTILRAICLHSKFVLDYLDTMESSNVE